MIDSSEIGRHRAKPHRSAAGEHVPPVDVPEPEEEGRI
jgi:hypothetical protein